MELILQEIDKVASLPSRIDDFRTAEPDTLRWKHNTDGQFSVKRVYRMEGRVPYRGQPNILEKLMDETSFNQGKMLYLLGG
ncbi:hypothetical protein KY289_013374 [Solanum tuberosum]|nr:hypothetical protein KY289_013374 [Solanum tuberosum]KAH0698538.1 hypothetical protein KY284_012753 [Solanum tuberosum]